MRRKVITHHISCNSLLSFVVIISFVVVTGVQAHINAITPFEKCPSTGDGVHMVWVEVEETRRGEDSLEYGCYTSAPYVSAEMRMFVGVAKYSILGEGLGGCSRGRC